MNPEFSLFEDDFLTQEQIEDEMCGCQEDCYDYDNEDDGQPDEYTEWQDYMGGDDWDHGQYDCDF